MNSVMRSPIFEQNTEYESGNKKKFFNIIDDLFFVLSSGGYIIETNNVSLQKLGYHYNDLIGTDIIQLCSQDKVHQIRDCINDATAFSDKKFTLDLLKNNKEIIPVELHMTVSTWNAEPTLICICRDNSERVVLKKSVDEGYARLELALEGADLGMWDWNIQTGEIGFNERWAQMLGYRSDELEKFITTWVKLLHPDDSPAIIEKINDHLDGKTLFYEAEYRLISKDGSHIWVLNRGKVVELDSKGKPLRAAGTHLDISHRKKIEHSLEQHRSHLDKLVSEKTEENNNLYKRLFILQEEERQKISQDLHDSVGQTILAAKLNIDTYKSDPQQYNDRLDVGILLIEKASRELREIYTHMYPRILSDLGLDPTIRWLVNNTLESNGIRTSIYTYLSSRLLPELEVGIYRILQEILSNILKHAQASEVSLYLSNACDGLRLLVSDNGIGYCAKNNNNNISTGFGIPNIRQRVNCLNGTFIIKSGDPRGTIIEILI